MMSTMERGQRSYGMYFMLALFLLGNKVVDATSMMRGSDSRTLASSSMHYIACGGKRCVNENGDTLPLYKASDDDRHEVRCCSDTKITWKKHKKKNQCPWAGSHLPALNGQCSAAVDYETAVQYCEDSDARLCTKEEVQKLCTMSSGCGLDKQFIWTSTPYEEPDPFFEPSVSSTGSHVLVCGNPNGGANCIVDNEFQEIYDGKDEEKQEVRCCSDTKITWPKSVKNKQCSVWGASNIPVFEDYGFKCHADKTFAEAEEICHSAGARLCTEQEILDGCVSGSGCDYDNEFIWTSTEYVAPDPIEQSDLDYWLTCGNGKECTNEYGINTPLISMDGLSVHAIRCCSDTELFWNGAVQNERSCPGVWGGTYIPISGTEGKGECKVGTFAEAEAYCSRAGARLCTLDEMLDRCALGSGCRYDDEFVWTSTEVDAELLWQDPEPTDGFHTLACGNPNKVNAPGCMSQGTFYPSFRAADAETHEVRCCSDVELPFFVGSPAVKEPGCGVWGISEIPVIPFRSEPRECIRAATYWDAKYICESSGARLCTATEVLEGCTRNSGCRHDDEWVWTETSACASNEELEAVAHVDKYVGCYTNPRKKPELPFKVGKHFSIDMCYNSCLAAGYAFFGMHNGDTCFCGDDKDTSKEVDEIQCSKQCSLGPGTCGGPKTNSVFVTGLTATGEYNYENQYLGCFEDDDDVVFDQVGTESSIASCVESCTDANYVLASLSEGGVCSCSDQRPTAKSVSCLEPCVLGRGLCGSAQGLRGNSVYKTKVQKQAIQGLLECRGAKASWWGDPHFITFDKLSYNCQGLGHFIVTECADWELQALFKSRPNSRASVTDGIAAKYKDYPVVQVNIAHFEDPRTTTISDCPVHVFVDGELMNQTEVMSDVIDIHPVGNGFEIQFPEAGPALRIKVRMARNCVLDVDECVPENCWDSTKGMLGTPNGNKDDDWMTRDGTTIFPLPENYKSQGGYDYCTREWCVQSEEASLFTYGGEKGFDEWDECAADFPGDILIEDVPPAIQALCAGLPNEEECLEEAGEGNPVENVLENNNDIEDIDEVEDDEPESPDTPPLCPEAVKVLSTTGAEFNKWPIEVLGYNGTNVDLKIKSPLFDDETIQFYHVEYGIETPIPDNCESFLDVGGNFEATITASCLHSSEFAMINIYASDSVFYSLELGDTAIVPECCHTPDSSEVATVQYSFKVSCKDVCVDEIEA